MFSHYNPNNFHFMEQPSIAYDNVKEVSVPGIYFHDNSDANLRTKINMIGCSSADHIYVDYSMTSPNQAQCLSCKTGYFFDQQLKCVSCKVYYNGLCSTCQNSVQSELATGGWAAFKKYIDNKFNGVSVSCATPNCPNCLSECTIDY